MWVLPLDKYEILLDHLLMNSTKLDNVSDSLFETLNVMLYFCSMKP